MFVFKSVFVAATIAAFAATGAAAQSSGLQTVSYSDLDLSTQSGVRTLERRVAHAIEAMCGHDPVMEGMLLDAGQAQCEADTLAATRAQIDAKIAAGRAKRVRTAGL